MPGPNDELVAARRQSYRPMTIKKLVRILQTYSSQERVLIQGTDMQVFDIVLTPNGVDLRLSAAYLEDKRWKMIEEWPIKANGWHVCRFMDDTVDICMKCGQQWFRLADDDVGVIEIKTAPVQFMTK